jgi:hypothetical protein
MNSKILELAQQAGFCLWENEDWKPAGAVIDWAAQYDEQFQMFVELLLRDVASFVDNKITFGVGEKILERYGIDE